MLQAHTLDETANMKLLMAFPLTPVSLIIGTSDGILLKVDKAKRMRYLLKNQLSREKPGEKPLVIEDENVLFCALKDIHQF